MMRDAVERTGVHQEQIHISVAVVVQPAPARAVGLDNVGNFCVAELVDELNAGLDGDILEQIIRPGGNRRNDCQRWNRQGCRAGGTAGEMSIDRNGNQCQGQAGGTEGGDFAEETFVVHKKMPDAGVKQ
jgi:hypothetical protein